MLIDFPKNQIRISIALSFFVFGLQGCGGSGSSSAPTPTPAPAPAPAPAPPPGPTGDATMGAMVFTSPQQSGNQFSCANCHAVVEDDFGFSTEDGLHRPAHPLFNVINRSSFHNTTSTVLFDAVNICLQDWQHADTWTESTQEWLDLEAYFQQQSDNEATSNIVATQVEPITDFTDGDITTGQMLFNQSCATCHGGNALGSDIAGNLTLLGLDATRVAQKARTSGSTSNSVFPGLTGGNMPFWSQERLSDGDLKDIAVYVDSVSPISTSSCSDSDHPKVGLVANLSTIAHNVSGRAEIIDNCTIEVTNFNFDGNAPNVVFYGAADGNYNNGYTISERLDGTPFVNATYTITLNSPLELNNLDGISVWCVEFSANFGDGLFQ